MVLREGTTSQVFHEISFDSMTFFIQTHGLASKYLHSNNGVKIGGQLDRVFKKSIYKKAIVGGNVIQRPNKKPIFQKSGV